MHVVVCFIFLIGFLIGTICFERVIVNEEVRDEIVSYDYFYEDEEINKREVGINLLYEIGVLILTLWVIGISVVGAPFLVFFCMYKGLSLAVILSGVLLKYGIKTGYGLLIKNLFLPYVFKEFVIIFLTVSSIKVTYGILCEKKDIKGEVIRHSVNCVVGLILLLAGGGLNFAMILNNFT